jgi:drug/metabolite transporter (DMT)-like permease
MRWLTALVFILPFTFQTIRAQLPLIRANLKYLTFMGVISVGTFNTLVYLSAHYTTTHHIALICATSPVWTVLLAGIFKLEKLTSASIIGAAIAFFGALVIITEGNLGGLRGQNWNYGDILLLIAAIIWAVYSVMLKRKPKELSTTSFLTVIIFIGLLWLLPFYLWEVAQGVQTPLDGKALFVYFYTGVGASLIAWFCWSSAVAALGSVRAGLISYTMPVFSAILAIFLLGEPLETYHIIGFLFVLAGIIVTYSKKSN